MWSTRSARPNWRIAAALSPPPITVNPRQSATASATARVPAANGSSSKTPIGPFQSTFAAPLIVSSEDRGRLGSDVEALPTVGDP